MGIHDRDYMRPNKPGLGERLNRIFARATAAHWSVGVLVAAWIFQLVASAGGHDAFLYKNIGLSADSLRDGKVWELLTYALLHGGVLHILFNALGLWFLGRSVIEEHGTKKFWQIFLGGIFAGGLLWSAVWLAPKAPGFTPDRTGLLEGASGGVLALMAYYMADKLRDEFRMLLALIVPITLEGAWILGITAMLSLLGFLLTEIPAATGWWRVVIADVTVGHSAHLGGLLLGFGWAKLAMRRAAAPRIIEYREPDARRERPERRERPRPVKAVSVEASAPGADTDMRGEVDRILDKINAQGFGALTAEERALLEKARETLGRR